MSPTADVIYMGNGIHVGLKRVKPTVRGNPRLAPHTHTAASDTDLYCILQVLRNHSFVLAAT